MKNKKFAKAVCLMAAIASILAFPVKASAAAQGTDGTELEVVQAQQVEIQLGPNWSGVEFEMKTDAGMYPGTIPVGEDGILRFEVGGSESYILSCMNSKQEAPVPDETVDVTEDTDEIEPSATEETAETTIPNETETDSTGESTEIAEVNGEVESAPIVYIVITVVGVALALAALVYLISSQKKSESECEDDEDLF